MFEPVLPGLVRIHIFSARHVLSSRCCKWGSLIRSQIPTHYGFEAVYTHECMTARQPCVVPTALCLLDKTLASKNWLKQPPSNSMKLRRRDTVTLLMAFAGLGAN